MRCQDDTAEQDTRGLVPTVRGAVPAGQMDGFSLNSSYFQDEMQDANLTRRDGRGAGVDNATLVSGAY